MENFDQIFTLIAEEKGISLNTDILETGLINILALVGILIYTGKDFLGSVLEERKTTIVQNVQDAEDRLSEAQKRLVEAQKQLNQASVVITDIKTETLATKKKMLDADALEARNDLKFRFERAVIAFKSKERQIFFEIKGPEHLHCADLPVCARGRGHPGLCHLPPALVSLGEHIQAAVLPQ